MKLFYLFILIFFVACNSGTKSNSVDDNVVFIKKASAKSTIEETLKERFRYDLQFSVQVQLIDKEHFYAKHRDEILRTLKVVESVQIPEKDIVVVFYQFSIAADVVHETVYMRKIDGNWYFHLGYYASYDDDPFKNGRGEDGKQLLKKMETWKESDSNPWWE